MEFKELKDILKATQTAINQASAYKFRIDELEKRVGFFEAGQTTRNGQLENRLNEFESTLDYCKSVCDVSENYEKGAERHD